MLCDFTSPEAYPYPVGYLLPVQHVPAALEVHAQAQSLEVGAQAGLHNHDLELAVHLDTREREERRGERDVTIHTRH